ncbi:hypothetical protein PHBOTO_005345 [Pseudozyma hubeiensis]|nr:hypothetical protein PHBOTO_005345 [Pseudozyma hubeiensis]
MPSVVVPNSELGSAGKVAEFDVEECARFDLCYSAHHDHRLAHVQRSFFAHLYKESLRAAQDRVADML